MPRLPLALAAALAAAGCFSPTWEARLAGQDGGPGPSDASCLASCAGRACGDDGCGGSCGVCLPGTACEAYQCVPCGPSCAGKACGDDGCGGSCGACAPGLTCQKDQCVDTCPSAQQCGKVCCASDQACVNGACLGCGCGNRECGTDACGLPCGTCVAPKVCKLPEGVCNACVSSCSGKVCGDDGCGGSCGACPPGSSCNAGRCQGCGCYGRECGDDGCGTSCGTCPKGSTCADSRCSCVPSCAGRQCGDDGCGGSCGACPAGTTCSKGTCVGCTPSCANKECGDDGCGGTCAECLGPTTCYQNRCVTCVPRCSGKRCGDDGCGGSCGECPPDAYCNANGSCVALGCSPPCSPVQYCDPTSFPPTCIEVCNPPLGCPPGQSCDVATGQCLGSCDPATCGPGQGCWDPYSYEGGDSCTCLPYRQDASGTTLPDTCAGLGQTCDWDYANPKPASCRPSREFEDCVPIVGCGAGLECVALGGYSLCLQPCTKTADCRDAMTSCQAQAQNHCWYNFCAWPENNPLTRARYFKPCAASGVADGLCLPVTSADANGAPIDIGLCFQTGTAPSLGRCSPDADRTRPAELCPQGQSCMGMQPDPNRPGQQLGTCQPACNAAPQPSPSFGCTGDTTCLDLSQAASGTLTQARLGLCFPKCNVFGTDGCTPDALGNPRGCSPTPDLGGQGFCYSSQANPGQPGASCVPSTDTDLRNPCGDRLWCVDTGAGSRCLGFCSTQTCPSPYQSCAGCRPSPAVCYAFGGSVGMCWP